MSKQLGAIPVDLNGRCVVAEEIGDRDKDNMHPLKWKCTNECRKLTSEEVALVLRTSHCSKCPFIIGGEVFPM